MMIQMQGPDKRIQERSALVLSADSRHGMYPPPPPPRRGFVIVHSYISSIFWAKNDDYLDLVVNVEKSNIVVFRNDGWVILPVVKEGSIKTMR